MKCRKGFTLIELLIVVLILGALAAISIPKISASAETARVNACKTNINLINSQIQMYYQDTGEWPNNLKKVTKNTDYFPEGEPICPVTGTVYDNALLGVDRIDDSAHHH